MLYVALGDSITAGESATAPGLAYPSLVVRNVQRMTRGASVSQNAVLAEPGWTSGDLLGALAEQPPSVLRRASAITVWVGGDNLVSAGLAMAQGASMRTLERSIVAYARSLKALLAIIRSSSRGRILVCTQYNPFPNTPIAAQGIGLLNETTMTVASAMGTGVVPVHAWFEGNQAKWIAGYRTGRIRDAITSPVAPVHPNNLGHRAIADGLTPLIL